MDKILQEKIGNFLNEAQQKVEIKKLDDIKKLNFSPSEILYNGSLYKLEQWSSDGMYNYLTGANTPFLRYKNTDYKKGDKIELLYTKKNLSLVLNSIINK